MQNIDKKRFCGSICVISNNWLRYAQIFFFSPSLLIRITVRWLGASKTISSNCDYIDSFFSRCPVVIVVAVVVDFFSPTLNNFQ